VAIWPLQIESLITTMVGGGFTATTESASPEQPFASNPLTV
jgi:hypothetical protein